MHRDLGSINNLNKNIFHNQIDFNYPIAKHDEVSNLKSL